MEEALRVIHRTRRVTCFDWLNSPSSEFAFQEGVPLVPNTPDDRTELRQELRSVAERLDVAGRLNAYGNTLNFLDQLPRNARYFLLELNGSSGELRLQGFRSLHQATDAYDAMERATAADPDVDVVLVSVESLTQLKRAYPNYFLDTTVFVNALEDVLSE